MDIKKFIRDPLLHFLIAGLFLFFVFDRLSSPSLKKMDSKMIVVDQQTMLNYIRNRYGILDEAQAKAKFQTFNEERRAELIDDYVREEILAREALKMGFQADDFAVRSVLVDKMLFIASILPDETALKHETVKQYFEDNKELFFIRPKATFFHVFFDKTKHNSQEIEMAALQTRDELNEQGITPDATSMIGDPSPVGHYAMEWDYRLVENTFGKQTADALFALPGPQGPWAGPFRSEHGLHLFKMVNKIEGRTPEFKEVMGEVRMHYREVLLKQRVEEQVSAFRDNYDVRIDL